MISELFFHFVGIRIARPEGLGLFYRRVREGVQKFKKQNSHGIRVAASGMTWNLGGNRRKQVISGIFWCGSGMTSARMRTTYRPKNSTARVEKESGQRNFVGMAVA